MHTKIQDIFLSKTIYDDINYDPCYEWRLSVSNIRNTVNMISLRSGNSKILTN